MEEENEDNILFGCNANTTTTTNLSLNTYDISNGTVTNTDMYLYTDNNGSISYREPPSPTVMFNIDDESYDIKSIILLLKVLMKKQGLSEELLTMDYDKLEVILGRESKLDDLLNE